MSSSDEDTIMDPPEIPELVFSDEEGRPESQKWEEMELAPASQPFEFPNWYDRFQEDDGKVYVPFYTDFVEGANGVYEQVQRALDIRNEYSQLYQLVLVKREQFLTLDGFPLRILFMRYENYDLNLLIRAAGQFKNGLFVIIGLNSKEQYQWLKLEVIGMITKHFLYVTYITSDEDRNAMLFHPEDSIKLYDEFYRFFFNYAPA